MKTRGGVEVELEKGGWSTQRPPGKRPGNLCTEDWVGPRTGLMNAGYLAPTGTQPRPTLLAVAVQTWSRSCLLSSCTGRPVDVHRLAVDCESDEGDTMN
jgi:hypothetical protein